MPPCAPPGSSAAPALASQGRNRRASVRARRRRTKPDPGRERQQVDDRLYVEACRRRAARRRARCRRPRHPLRNQATDHSSPGSAVDQVARHRSLGPVGLAVPMSGPGTRRVQPSDAPNAGPRMPAVARRCARCGGSRRRGGHGDADADRGGSMRGVAPEPVRSGVGRLAPPPTRLILAGESASLFWRVRPTTCVSFFDGPSANDSVWPARASCFASVPLDHLGQPAHALLDLRRSSRPHAAPGVLDRAEHERVAASSRLRPPRACAQGRRRSPRN